MRLGGIGLDCDDPVQLSSFWAALLGGQIVHSSEGVVVVKVGDLVLNACDLPYRVPCRRSQTPTWPIPTAT